MDVKKITTNTNNAHEGIQTAKTIAFSGGGAYKVKEVSKLTESLKDAMPSYIGTMDKLRCLKGEAGGIIINSLGTGLVAPIFIAYNPLSKTDEQTKKYTALRQPVSAVLAILIQAGLTKPLNMLYEHLANNGNLGNSPYLDMSLLKDKQYFINKYKKFGPFSISAEKYAEEQVAQQLANVANMLEKEGAIRFAKNKQLSSKEVIELINKTLETYKTDITTSLDSLAKKDVGHKTNRAKMLIRPKNRKDLSKMCNVIKSLKDDDKLAKVLEPWLKSKNPEIQKLASEFLQSGSVATAKHRATQTIDKMNLFNLRTRQCAEMGRNYDYIVEKLTEVANSENKDISSIIKDVATKFDKKKNTELITKMFEELGANIDIKERQKYATELIESIGDIKNARGNKFKLIEIFQKSYYRNQKIHLNNKLRVIDSFKVPENLQGMTAKDLIENIKSQIANFNKKNFTIDMAKTWQKIVSKRFSGFKQIANILVGACITLPITCTALNWVYPRFMDIFFPHLSRNDKCAAPEENKDANKTGGAK